MFKPIFLTLTAALAISAGAQSVPTGFGESDHRNPNESPFSVPMQISRLAGGRQVPFVNGGESLLRSVGTPANLAAISRLRSNFESNTSSSPSRAFAPVVGSERLLVVYDYWSDYKFLGELYARQMKDLLSHFGWGVDTVPVQNYQAGMIGSHRATVYLGVFYDTDLPTAFKSDVVNARKPVCWTGYNLWKLARKADFSYDTAFESKFGFRFDGLGMGYKDVYYKFRQLNRNDQVATKLTINNVFKAWPVATMKNADGTYAPYIIKAGNLWVVNDNPLGSVQYSYVNGHDRTLAFADVLHDITNSGARTNQRAYVRIEDVGATANPAKLREFADILAAEKVPFVVSTIPFYRDPLGYWNYGTPYEQSLENAPEVIAALKYMESKGGRLIMHGYTHQYNDVANPFYGVSGSDWEFYRVLPNLAGGYTYTAPVIEDSQAWVLDRINKGRDIMQRAGFAKPTGWLTPHYMASANAYSVFAREFKYSLCPATHFTNDSLGYLYYQPLFTPYPIKDEYGTIRIPETLSYVSPGEPNMGAQQIISRVKDMAVVRDGWAGMYFHPFLDSAMLRDAVRGIKREGFTFTLPSEAFGPVPR